MGGLLAMLVAAALVLPDGTAAHLLISSDERCSSSSDDVSCYVRSENRRSCFCLNYNQMDYYDAKHFCDGLNATLVYVDSQAENDDIVEMALLNDKVGNKFWFWTSGSSSDTAWYWEPSGRSMDYSDWLIKREPTPKANSKMVIAFGTQYMNTVYQRWLSTADFFADLGTYLMTYVYYPRYALCRREMNATDVEVSIQRWRKIIDQEMETIRGDLSTVTNGTMEAVLEKVHIEIKHFNGDVDFEFVTMNVLFMWVIIGCLSSAFALYIVYGCIRHCRRSVPGGKPNPSLSSSFQSLIIP